MASFGGASVKRIHRPVDAEGKTISVGSYIGARAGERLRGARHRDPLQHHRYALRQDENGNVTGVEGVTKDGANVIVEAKAVVLATGGFGANLEMVASYKPELEGFMTTNAAGAQARHRHGAGRGRGHRGYGPDSDSPHRAV